MGINISLDEVRGPRHEDARMREDLFDCLRHWGDRDFVGWLSGEGNAVWTQTSYREVERRSDGYGFGDDVECYARPADFAAARAWVRANICEENQARLLDAFDLMERDPTLWFTWSY